MMKSALVSNIFIHPFGKKGVRRLPCAFLGTVNNHRYFVVYAAFDGIKKGTGLLVTNIHRSPVTYSFFIM